VKLTNGIDGWYTFQVFAIDPTLVTLDGDIWKSDTLYVCPVAPVNVSPGEAGRTSKMIRPSLCLIRYVKGGIRTPALLCPETLTRVPVFERIKEPLGAGGISILAVVAVPRLVILLDDSANAETIVGMSKDSKE